MALFRGQSFVKFKLPRVSSFSAGSNSIGDQPSACKQVSTEETTGEILNQILSSCEDPGDSREEICTGFIQKLCATGNLPAATALLRALRGKHIFLGPRPYNCLLEAANSRNDLDTVSQVFKDLIVSSTPVNFTSYLIIGRGFGNHRNSAMLLNFIKGICELELPRVDIVLNRVIHALAKCGHPGSALLVFYHMKELKCKPDLVTYNTVLAVLGNLGRVDDMLSQFGYMKEVGVIPDVVTYNTMLNCLRKMGRLDLCVLYFKEMSERGLQPDLFTFKPLIESLGRSGNIDDAVRVFYEMKRNGIFPSVHIYRALLFGLKRMGKTDLALEISTEMNRVFRDGVGPGKFPHRTT